MASQPPKKKPTPAQMELILRYVNPYEDDFYIDYFNPSEAKRKRLEDIISVPRGIPVIPEVGFCVMLKTLNPQSTAYLNVCHCEEIPRPHDEDIQAGAEGIVKLPLSISAPHVEYEESGEKCYAFDVLINSSFYQEHVYTDKYFKEYVVALGRRGMLNRYNVDTSKDVCVMMNKKFRGTLYQPFIRRTPETEIYFRNYITVLCEAERERRKNEDKEEGNVKSLLNDETALSGFVNSGHNNGAMGFQTNCDIDEIQPSISVGASVYPWRHEIVFDAFSKEINNYLEEKKDCCINTPDVFSEAMRFSSAQETKIYSFGTDSANMFHSPTLPPVTSPANDISLCTNLPKQKSTMKKLNSEQRTTLTPEENSFVAKSVNIKLRPIQYTFFPYSIPGSSNDTSSCTKLPEQKSMLNCEQRTTLKQKPPLIKFDSEQRTTLSSEKSPFGTNSAHIKFLPYESATFLNSIPGPSNDISPCTNLPKQNSRMMKLKCEQRPKLSPEEYSFEENFAEIFFPHCFSLPKEVPHPATYHKMLPNRNTVNRKRAIRLDDDSEDPYLIHKEAVPFFFFKYSEKNTSNSE